METPQGEFANCKVFRDGSYRRLLREEKIRLNIKVNNMKNVPLQVRLTAVFRVITSQDFLSFCLFIIQAIGVEI